MRRMGEWRVGEDVVGGWELLKMMTEATVPDVSNVGPAKCGVEPKCAKLALMAEFWSVKVRWVLFLSVYQIGDNKSRLRAGVCIARRF